MKLSLRLQTVASFIKDFNSLIDIGSDHGHLPIFLKCNYPNIDIIATEVSASPYSNLVNNIKESGLDIKCIQTDGLTNLPPAEVITICGMGGKLISKILTDTDYLETSKPTLILEPQSNFADLRKTLISLDYQIIKEKYVIERNKYYPVIYARYEKGFSLNQIELQYGQYPLINKDEVLKKLLLNKYKLLKNIDKRKDELDIIKSILIKYFDYKDFI